MGVRVGTDEQERIRKNMRKSNLQKLLMFILSIVFIIDDYFMCHNKIVLLLDDK